MVGEGAFFDEGSGEEPLRPPPLLDDRLWRHPSEVSREPGLGRFQRVLQVGRRSSSSRRRASGGRLMSVVLVAGAAGALLSTGLVLAAGWLHPGAPSDLYAGAGAYRPTVAVSTSPAHAGTVSAGGQIGSDGKVSAGVRAMVDSRLPGIVSIATSGPSGSGRGTGLVLRSDGIVLTTASLVAGAQSVTVVTRDGRRWTAAVVGEDPDTGAAIVRIGATGLDIVSLDHPGRAAVGQLVLEVTTGQAPASPLGISVGVLEAVHRKVDMAGGVVLLDAMETDDPPPQDPSGGVLLDAQGDVVGIMQAVVQDGGQAHGVGTPLTSLLPAADQLVDNGKVVHGWLGIEGSDVGQETASSLGLTTGALVQRVEPASPAATAGVLPGDVIGAVDGQPVSSMADLQRALRPLSPGTMVTLSLERGHSQVTVSAQLGGNGS